MLGQSDAARDGHRSWGRQRRQHPSKRRGGGPLAILALTLAVLAACGAPATAASGHSTTTAPTATARPARSAAAAPTLDYRLALVNQLIAHMTLDQELGQLFIVSVTYPDFTSDLQQSIGQLNAGGVILYQSGIYTIPQTQQLTGAMQHAAAIPLIIGADEEGDGDPQIEQIYGSHLDAMQIGATGDPSVATREATSIGQQLKQLGLNTDFAPVVDVLAVGWNWTRSFGRSPDLVSKMGAAEVDALQGQGVIATLKHFPGLGAMNCNPHFCLPVINSSRDYIEQYDLAPYRALMSHQPGMIMTTDLLMPALDAQMPAELSYPIVTGILRKEIGYDGVVVTDALYMAGITERYSMAQAGVLAIEAGNDMIEGPGSASELRYMEDALRHAVESGQLTKARIDESVRRILLLKLRFGLLPLPPSAGQRDVTLAPASGGPATGAAMGGQALVPDQRRQLPAASA